METRRMIVEAPDKRLQWLRTIEAMHNTDISRRDRQPMISGNENL